MHKANKEDLEKVVFESMSKHQEIVLCNEIGCNEIKISDHWYKGNKSIMKIIELYKNNHKNGIRYDICDEHKKKIDIEKRMACGCKECCEKHYKK